MMPVWRVVLLCLVLAGVGAVAAQPVAAQDDRPSIGLPEKFNVKGSRETRSLIINDASRPEFASRTAPDFQAGYIRRDPGLAFSLSKLGFLVAMFLLWVGTTTWVSSDAQKQNQNWTRWNLITFGAGAGVLAFAFVFPWFWVSMPIVLAAYIAPLAFYIRARNANLPPHEQVMTAAHIRYWLAKRLKPLGIKIQAELKSPEDLEPVKFKPKGAADAASNQTNLLTARRSPAFAKSLDVMVTALQNNASLILIELSQQGGAVRYLIDGLWEPGDTLDATTGVALAGVYKQIANLNPNEHRQKLSGNFGAVYQKTEVNMQITSAPTQTGARVILVFDDGGKKLESLEQLGFGEESIKKIKEMFTQPQGLILVSAPPAGGQSLTYNGVLRAADRYIKSWVAIEDKQIPERKVENVEPTFYDSAAGETPVTVLPKLIRLYPDCYACRHLPDAQTVRMLLGPEIAGENHVVLSAVRAKEAVEAPLRVLMLQDATGSRIAPTELAPALLGSINVRLVRRLCTECKEAYEPTQQMLQQMRVPVKQGEQILFYKPPVINPADPKAKQKICKKCNGRGYLGRAAMAEVLVMTPAMKQALASTPKLDVLRVEARKAGMKTLQEDGIRLIAAGVTSIEEVTRVLKEGQA